MTAITGESTTWMCRKDNVRVNPKHLSWLLVKFCRQEPIKDKLRGTFGKPEVVSSIVPLCLFWAFTKMYLNICVFLVSIVSIPYFYLLSTGIPSTCTYILLIYYLYHLLGIWNKPYIEGVAMRSQCDFLRGNTQSDRTPCGPWNHGLHSRFSWQNPIHFCRVPGLFWKSFFRSPSWPKNSFFV